MVNTIIYLLSAPFIFKAISLLRYIARFSLFRLGLSEWKIIALEGYEALIPYLCIYNIFNLKNSYI